MNNTMLHRGPDGWGLLGMNGRDPCLILEPDPQSLTSAPSDAFSSRYRIGLGHRRLSIIDLHTGAQPICNEDGSVWTTFNGEIYNHRELRAELQARGHIFRTDHSDTEVLVHGWEEWDEALPGKLAGMFAFAIYDARKMRLFLARDQLGIKPLYWGFKDGLLSFGSELKSLAPIYSRKWEIDSDAIRDYLLMGYVPAPGSIFKNINKLEAAHCLTLDLSRKDASPRSYRYWQPGDYRPSAPSPQEEDRELENILNSLSEVVNSHLDSDVPFGAFLSGGTDSSLITALMTQKLGAGVKTFTMGFSESDYDESSYARKVAAHLKTDHLEKILTPDIISLLPRVVRGFDEPFSDISAIPTLLVSELASSQVKMVLTGDGGDELFWGYSRYLQAHRMQAVDIIPLPIRAKAVGLLQLLLPDDLKLRRAALRLGVKPIERYHQLVGVFDLPELKHTFRYKTQIITPLRNFTDAPEKWSGDMDSASRIDISTYLPEDILTKVDRMGMAVSLEARVPMLDRRFVEIALKTSPNLKVKNGMQKLALKKILTLFIAPSEVYRPKMGFGVPFGAWIRGSLRNWVLEQIEDKSSPCYDWVDYRATNALIRAHLSGNVDHGPRIWSLLVLNESLRQLRN